MGVRYFDNKQKIVAKICLHKFNSKNLIMGSQMYILLLSLLFQVVSNSILGVTEHQNNTEFAQEVLKRHNELRKIHNGPGHDLELSKELSEEADDFAKDAARDSSVLEDPEPGQNVFMACSTYNRALTGKEITDSW